MRYLAMFFYLAFISFGCYGQSNKKILKLLQKEPDAEMDVLTCDKNWENQLDYATVLRVDSMFVMYYRALNSLNKPHTAYCYAVSKDGLHWEKPNLGVFSYAGSKQNNIITDRVDGVSVEFSHGNFWMIADRYYDKQNQVVKGLVLFSSEDGVHFEKDDRLKIPFFCDSQNEIMWDETTKTFKLYLRSWYKSQVKTIEYHHTHQRYRSVSLLELPSLDYVYPSFSKHVTSEGEIKHPSLKNEYPIVLKNNSLGSDFDIYCAYVHKYRDNLYIAYPINYYHTDDKKRGGIQDNDGYGTIGFWTSKNGRTFKEVKRDYITNGTNWIEFSIGHVETKDMFIHYYIQFKNSHAGKKNKNSIRARIHYKN